MEMFGINIGGFAENAEPDMMNAGELENVAEETNLSCADYFKKPHQPRQPKRLNKPQYICRATYCSTSIPNTRPQPGEICISFLCPKLVVVAHGRILVNMER